MTGCMYIGIDLGGTNIKAALITDEGNIVAKKKIPTMSDLGNEEVAKRISHLIIDLTELKEDGLKQIIGVGIGVPGQPNREEGKVILAPNLSWHNVPLTEMLKIPSLPVFLENDANLAALGEAWTGAGRDSQNLVMITIGTGIGAGIIINGDLYLGACGSAGELGHSIVDPNGPPCSCGRYGCLETFCSATAMVKNAKELLEKGKQSSLAENENLEARDIVEAARHGDSLALKVLETTANYLGIGLGNIINILNPDTIIIGGGVSEAGEILFNPLRDTALKCSLEVPGCAVNIVPARLGNDAGVIGAARLVKNKTDKNNVKPA